MSHPEPPSPRVHPPLTRKDYGKDILLAVALFATGAISVVLASLMGAPLGNADKVGPALALMTAQTLPLAARRRIPITVSYVVCGAYFLSFYLDAPEFYVSQVTMFMAIFTVGAWTENRRRAVIGRATLIAVMFVWLIVTTFTNATDTATTAFAGAMTPYVAYSLIQWLVNVAYFGGAYYMGDRAYDAAREHMLLARRTDELEEERELTAAQAVALDRVRIARELHDVVAHHVSAMGVQAGAARTVLETNPEAARTALTAIEDSSRSAISELHHLLDTLRAGSAGGDTTSEPSTLSLGRLEELAETMTASGTPTTLVTVGEKTDVPELVQVNLYRVAQEALTNVRRHGGPEAHAEVRLRYSESPRAVELEITNTGRVALTARAGLGQLGMRERAIASGGTLELHPRPQGGFLVRVSVPLAGAGADTGTDTEFAAGAGARA